jgi:hypothetical protein
MPDWLFQGVTIALVGAVVLGAFALLRSRISALWRRLSTRGDRPRLVVGHRIGHEPVYLGLVPTVGPSPKALHDFMPVAARDADLVWISIKNNSDRPESDALDVTARLWFSDEAGRALFDFPARRRDSLQVWQVGGDAMSIIDRLPIPAGYTRELDVAFRYDGEAEAYGLNTEAEAYPDWKKADWRLAPGEYRVRVRISGANFKTIEAEWDLTVAAPPGRLGFMPR